MKLSDVTQYVFDATIGYVLLIGLTTADVMHLFHEDYSLHFYLMQAGVSEVVSVGLTFVVYLTTYSVISRVI